MTIKSMIKMKHGNKTLHLTKIIYLKYIYAVVFAFVLLMFYKLTSFKMKLFLQKNIYVEIILKYKYKN